MFVAIMDIVHAVIWLTFASNRFLVELIYLCSTVPVKSCWNIIAGVNLSSNVAFAAIAK